MEEPGTAIYANRKACSKRIAEAGRMCGGCNLVRNDDRSGIRACRRNAMICLTTINRFAIILLPMQACMDWIRSCPDGDSCPTLDELRREPTVHLIPEGKAEPESYVRHHYKAMFESELCRRHRRNTPASDDAHPQARGIRHVHGA